MKVVIWFSSEHCKACNSFVGHWDELLDKYKGILFQKVCVEENPEEATAYNIIYYPTFVFFKDGTMFEKRIIGADRMELEKEIIVLAGL